MSTPSHVDLSVLWVPIMPETSKLDAAMEQVGKDATESFGKGSEKLGDKIGDSITKSRDKIRDVFHRTGTDAADSVADGVKQNSSKVEEALGDTGAKAKGRFREAIGDIGREMVNSISPDVKRQLTDRVEDVVGGAFKSVLGDNGIGGMIGDTVGKAASQGVGGWLDDLKGKVTGVKDAAGKTRQAFADFSSGDTVGGVSKLVDGFEKLGGDVHDLPQPLRDIAGEIGDMRGAAEDFAGIFKDLPGVVGRVGSAIEDLAGPIGVAAAAAATIWNGLPGIGGGLKQIMASPTTVDTSLGALGLPQGLDNPSNVIAMPGAPQPIPEGALPPLPIGAHYQASQGSLDPFSALLPPGMAMPDVNKPIPLAPIDMPDGAPLPGSVPIVQNPDGTITSPDPSWAHLIQRESGGRNVRQGIIDSNSGGNEAEGYFQITPQTWAAHGGKEFAPHPLAASPQQQAEIAARIFQSNPSGSDWGAGLPGRENASALLGGLGAGGNPMSGGVGKQPAGTRQDPLFVAPAATGNGRSGAAGSSDAPPWESQGHQLGQGFLGGIAQSVGLDGSVFKGFGGASGNPMDFGALKIGSHLLNWGMGMMGHAGGPKGTDTVPAWLTPGEAVIPKHLAQAFRNAPHFAKGTSNVASADTGSEFSFIKAAVGLGDALFSDLFNPGPPLRYKNRDIGGGTGGEPWSGGGPKDPFPNTGVAIAGKVIPTGGQPPRKSESVVQNNYYGDVNPFTVTQHGVKGRGTEEWQHTANSSGRRLALGVSTVT